MIQPVDISAESLKWISKSIGVSDEDILSKGQKLLIESIQRTFFRIPFKDKSSILMVVPEGIDESIESALQVLRKRVDPDGLLSPVIQRIGN
mgnify:CR=1 FL=1